MDSSTRLTPLTRTDASAAVEAIGWRYLLGTLCTSVPVPSMLVGSRAASDAVSGCGADADRHLRVDLRRDRVELSLQTREIGAVTALDVELAHRVTETLASGGGLRTAGATGRDGARPVQMLEIAIDAIDIPAIRPFWKAVLAYTDEPGQGGPCDGLVDPAGQLPTIWFQQMDAPRPQRNRVHFDITVSNDEADDRVKAALAADGVLVNGSNARAFWILADREGNEVCVCTWQDRD